MTKEQFETLIGTLEVQIRREPARYRLRVLLLAMLGNAYLGGLLLLSAFLFVGLLASISILKWIAVKLASVVGIFLLMLIRALWIKSTPPEGTVLQARDAPDLFGLIEQLRQRLDAPPFHRVLITDDLNAGVVQVPRLGVLGLYRNYLLIGLPLMKTISVEQFKAVLAHEFGHLAGGDGRTSNWIYHQRIRWMRLAATLGTRDRTVNFLFKPFLKWYAPYFNAHAFPLARVNEYQADAVAARLTSPRAMAEALTGIDVTRSYLDKHFWPRLYQQADDLPEPALMPYTSMGVQVAVGFDGFSTSTCLEQVLAVQSTLDDTHPALAERLKALGETPHLAAPAMGQAADQLLGPALAGLAESFDRRWREAVLPSWQQRHNRVQAGRLRLTALDARHQSGSELTLPEAFERACMTESVGANAEAALDQFRALHNRDPDDALTCFHLGARLLSRQDASGCALVERAMQIEPDATLSACAVLRDYFQNCGNSEQAGAWRQRQQDRAALEQAADEERVAFHRTDKLLPHDLSESRIAELRVQLGNIAGLRRAYLVKKKVKYLPERACYLLGFGVTGTFQMHSVLRVVEVEKSILDTVTFPGRTLVCNVEGENSRLGRKLRRMPEARIF